MTNKTPEKYYLHIQIQFFIITIQKIENIIESRSFLNRVILYIQDITSLLPRFGGYNSAMPILLEGERQFLASLFFDVISKTCVLVILHNQEKCELRTLVFINQLEKIASAEIVCVLSILLLLQCTFLHLCGTARYRTGTVLYLSTARYCTVLYGIKDPIVRFHFMWLMKVTVPYGTVPYGTIL